MTTEQTKYTVILHEDSFEVRAYPALLAAEVSVRGARGKAGSAGFRLLAGYIFGGNAGRLGIDMTAPVVQTEHAGEWTMRFTMPSVWTMATLPEPRDTRVHRVALPPARFAVVKFSGLAGEADVRQKAAGLMGFIAAHGLVVAGPLSLARYNPPWTPWFRRRNEVMIPLQN